MVGVSWAEEYEACSMKYGVSFGVFLAAAVVVGCSPKVAQEINATVNAATGIGAIEAKLQKVDPTLAKVQCMTLCQQQLAAEADLSAGPCLGNPTPGYPDWVCDVAHSPRTAVDNAPANQCAAFAAGTARHFVQVDANCAVIRAE